jgi:hypothetical protein
VTEPAKKLPDIEKVSRGVEQRKRVSIEREGADGSLHTISAIVVPVPENEIDEVAGDAKVFLAHVLRDVDHPDLPFAKTAEEIAEYLAEPEIEVLRRKAASHQDEAVPFFDAKQAIAFLDSSKESGKKNALICYRAANAQALFAFFGVPAVSVTDAQVLYFMGLMTAYNERLEQEKGRGVE